jgi:aminoglycoside 6'-N-acetyltransferase
MTIDVTLIRTERCRIDPLRADDAAALRAITDASVTSWAHVVPEPFSLADAEALIAASGEDHRLFAIRDPAGAELRGMIGAHKKPRGNVELSYWLAEGARGQGIAAEALSAMIAALFAADRNCRITAECHPDNQRSWAVLIRVGFTPTGRRGDRPGRMLLAWRSPANDRIDVC